VDAIGNVYVADTGNSAVKELTIASGFGTVTTLTNAYSAPTGVAVDSKGNVYIASAASKIAELEYSAAPATALVFGSTNAAGVKSADQAVTVENIGNADLTFSVATNIPVPFYSDSSTCPVASGSTLAAGTSCVFDIYFESATARSSSADLTLTDNNLNGTAVTQLIPMSGAALAAQTISFGSALPATAPYTTGLTYAITATGGASGNAVGLTVSGPATLSSATSPATLTVTGVGTITVTATQAAGGSYAAATAVSESINIAQNSQVITFPQINGGVATTYVSNPVVTIPLAAVSSAYNATYPTLYPITYSIVSGPGSIGGTAAAPTLIVNGAGTIIVAANQPGDDGYSAAAQVTQSLVVNKASQVLTLLGTTTLPASGTVAYSAGLTYTLQVSTSTESSNNPVTFTFVSGPGILSGTSCNTQDHFCTATLTVTGVGTIVVAENQAGNANYADAPALTQSLKITQASQALSFAAPASPVTWGSGTPANQQTITVTSTSSANPVTFTVTGPASTSNYTSGSGTASITLTYTGVGTITVNANQAGNSNYLAAPERTRDIVVQQAQQNLTFTALTTPFNNYSSAHTTETITVTGGPSGNPISVALVSGPATISGITAVNTVGTNATYTATLTFNAAGTVVLSANQAGNLDYQTAPAVTQDIVVNQTQQTVSFTQPAAATNGVVTYFVGETVPLTATALTAATATPASTATGLPVVFTVISGPGTVNATGTGVVVNGAGTILIAANQAGNQYYATAPTVTASIVVLQASQNITFTALASPVLYPGVSPVTLTAVGGISNNPVTFTLVSGPATITNYAFNPATDTATATLTYTGVGTVIVAANQEGNANYAAAPTVTQSILVNPAPDFTVTANPSAITISDGNTVTTTVTITPLNAFNAAVSLTCINLPANTTCSFAPSTVTPNGGTQSPEGGAASSLLTINTSATVGSNNSHPFLPVTSLAVVLGLFGIRKRRKLQMLLLVAVSIVGLGVFTGCGGVTGSSSTVVTESITVQATSGTSGTAGYVQHTTTFLLTIK
jgi:hypothetical protein